MYEVIGRCKDTELSLEVAETDTVSQLEDVNVRPGSTHVLQNLFALAQIYVQVI